MTQGEIEAEEMELAYWNFDALKNAEIPMTELVAFKTAARRLIHALDALDVIQKVYDTDPLEFCLVRARIEWEELERAYLEFDALKKRNTGMRMTELDAFKAAARRLIHALDARNVIQRR